MMAASSRCSRGKYAKSESGTLSQDACQNLATAYHDATQLLANYSSFKVDVGNTPAAQNILTKVM